MGISIDTVRVGKKYKLTNNSDITEFQVMEKLSETNFLIKDLTSLDIYQLDRLLQFGKGRDYCLDEL